MLKSTLLDIIRTFSRQELIRFEDFLKSPYFNKKENLITLFQHIKKYAPDFDADNLEKEKTWKVLFKNKEYNYGVIKNLIFDLTKLAELFIVENKFNDQEFRKNEFLISELLSRGLKRNYLNKNNSLNKELGIFPANSKSSNIGDYINLMSVIYDRRMFYSHMFDHNASGLDLQIQRDSYHISRLLLLLTGGYNDAEVYSYARNEELNTNPVTVFLNALSADFEKIISSLNKTSDQNQIYVKVKYLMYLAIREKTVPSYLKFKKIFFENIHLFPKADMHDMHYCLITAAVKAENKELSLSREIVEILDSMSDNNIILEQETGKMPFYIFNLYITNSFQLLDHAKIESFRDAYIEKMNLSITKMQQSI